MSHCLSIGFFLCRCLTLFLVGPVFLIDAYAQSRVFSHWSVNDGLSQSMVTSIWQDDEGRLWIGTADGLNQFLGKEFRTFRNYGNPDGRIPSNFITSGLAAEKNGTMLIVTKDGIYRFNPSCGKYSEVHIESDRKYGLPNDIGYIGVDASGNHWYFQALGYVYCLADQARSATTIWYNEDEWISFARMTPQGDILFCSDEGLFLYDPDTRQRTALSAPGYSNLILRDAASCENEFYVAGNHGIMWLNRKENKLEVVWSADDAPDTGVTAIYWHPGTSTWWTGLSTGAVVLLNGVDFSEQVTYSSNEESDSGLPLGIPGCFFPDENNCMWVGLDGGGLAMTTIEPAPFQTFRNGEPRGLRLASDYIRCLLVRGPDWLIAPLSGGLVAYNPDTETSRPLKVSGSRSSDLSVSALSDDRRGRVWLGAEGRIWVSRDGSEFHGCSMAGEETKIHQILELTDGRVIAFGEQASWIWDEAQNQFRVLDENLSPRWVFEDSRGVIWGSSYYGSLYQWEVTDDGLLIRDTLMDQYNVRCYAEDSDNGIIWMATEKGVLAFHNTTRKMQVYSTREGLANDFVYAVFLDHSGRVWCSSNQGVSCIHPASGHIRNYLLTDGLQSLEFNTRVFSRCPDGRVLLGGVSGINAFYPEKMKGGGFSPQAYLTHLNIDGREWPQDSLMSGQVELRSGGGEIRFGIGHSDYAHHAESWVAYQLEGRDTSWNTVQAVSDITLSGLDHGEYILRIRVRNVDGMWSSAKEVGRFNILAPYWRRPWFIGLAIVMIALSVWIFSRWQNRRDMELLRLRLTREREMQEIRIRISRDIHDDIGAGLSRIVLMSQLLDQGGDKGYTARISSTAREMVRQLGQIVWSLNPENDSLREVIYYLRQESVRFFEDTAIAVNFISPESPPDLAIDPRKRTNLIRVIREAMNNAMKYSGCNAVRIELNVKADEVEVNIRDNGKGFDPHNARGNGLRIMRRRIEEMGGVFELRSEIGGGTEIRFTIPLR